ncbi:hypothetical protein FMM05_07605 [Flavobacterium zepuense]|uniref:Lipoprotein n=1 Tax=Flavobacterium zepuense TaxID=2593302 RepID=A0A552V3V4_9FLAO|nr:hypothetical protein [Flavobacterium zepuense]TRW25164.1 hypothetical protein FMM05_07605 [Flavobacterium zepuense]
MRKSNIIKNSLLATALVAGMQIVTSCDGCSRKSDTMTTTEGRVDTVYIDTCMTPHDTVAMGYDGTGASGRSIRANAATSSNAGSSSNNNATAASGTAKPKKAGLTEEEITDKVENSSSQVGKPVNSGGTSGTGQGTGTGSTGNNSRVTTKKDQLTH